MGETKTPRLGYGDFLRCLSAVAVVTLHCAGATLATDTPGTTRFFILDLLDGGTRWAVPMFIMLSGMFLLDPDKPMPRRKWLGHVARVAVLILFWGFFFALWENYQAHPGLEWFLEGLIAFVAGRLHYHLWFLPMLLGLYLLTPLLRAFVRGASRATLWYAIGLWSVVTVLLGTFYQTLPGAVGQSWLNMLNLQTLAGYTGYFLLGYLLKTCAIRPRAEKILYALGALGLVATWAGTEFLSLQAGSFQPLLYGYLTPNVALAAAAVFLLARRLEVGRHPVWARLSALTLGVYVLHPTFIEVGNLFGLPRPEWNVAFCIPAQVLLVSIAAFGTTWLLRHIPKVGKILC